MKKLTLVTAALALLCLAGMAQANITIDTVTVGDVGNTADTVAHSMNPAGQGAVSYAYNIGKYEVTNSQYVAFLNAADAGGANANGIYNVLMGINARGGITYTSGSANGAKYTVRANMGDKPVNYVCWYDAARFTNWLGNGQGTGSTETGSYTLSGKTGIITKNIGATVYISSEDEWYKAAYYKGGSTTAGYWTYSTQSDTAPTVGTADASGNISNPGANVANYSYGADWNGQNGNVTTVGSAGATSYYGTFDQGGNVWEWNDAVINGNSRGLRGGSFVNIDDNLQSSSRSNYFFPSYESNSIGFRVSQVPTAAVPEPASLLAALGILGPAGLMFRRRRA
jgi:formylglycine-generating enzyme required for sulfatase activity